jgi:dolichol-phosphate mannosyltransferase
MISIALDGILAYSVIPLRLMTWAGLTVSAISFLLGTMLAVFRVMTWIGAAAPLGVVPPGLTQINVLITFLLGFNILCVGVLGEYVGRIYEEVKQRPIYLVQTVLAGK